MFTQWILHMLVYAKLIADGTDHEQLVNGLHKSFSIWYMHVRGYHELGFKCYWTICCQRHTMYVHVAHSVAAQSKRP